MSPLTLPQLAAEDLRILKILRRLLQESSPGGALELCNKLEVAVRAPVNAAFICRTFDILVDNMIGVLKQCPVECLEKASSVLGLMGYINRSDFPVYKNYLTKVYQSCKALRKYIMLALKTTFSCDAVNLDLVVYSERMLDVLKDYLENAEVSSTFIAVSETIAEFSKNYKRAFESHFTDIVDITVGWHLEAEQPQQLKQHCSMVLQQFAPYFLNDVEFTIDLLMQFLEDISAIGEELTHATTDMLSARNKAEARVGAFVGAFNSILKSLATRHKFVGITMCSEILNNAAVTIAKAAEQALAATLVSEETVLNINDFFCLIFGHSSSFIGLVNVEALIALQLKQFDFFSDAQKLSLLQLILGIFRQLRTSLPLSIVTLVFRTSENPLASIKLASSSRLQKLFLRLYHEVLMIKNVPLLQEAYRHVTADIDRAVDVLETCTAASHAYEVAKAEATLHFCLAALSALATQTSSIISMYALSPSILELLIVHCKAVDVKLWLRHSTLHHALLSVLMVHCQRNHNFRPTSRLLAEPLFPKHALDENNSPTSENFGTILQFLADILCDTADLPETNLGLLLTWTNCLLLECKENAAVLSSNANFQIICKAVCVTAISAVPLKCAACIQTALEYATLSDEVLEYMRDAAMRLLDSPEPSVRHTYIVILARLPLAVSLSVIKEPNAIAERQLQLYGLQQWYKATTFYAPLHSKYFKSFLEQIEACTSTEAAPLEQFAAGVFSKCWTARCRESAMEYQRTARASTSALTLWLQYEAARQCVRNKLRTAIGKPQETFLGIEAIITKYARTLSTRSGVYAGVSGLRGLVAMQCSARVLLGFLENLEKHIYNAAEGTAFAIPAIEKPAKTFFRINAHTCSEWLNRVRPFVNLIAIHCMEPEMVVRHSESILRMEKLSDVHMDHTVVSLVWALLSCSEPCTLQGLHVWLKARSGKRYVWVQWAADQAAGRKEQAATAYANFLGEHEGQLDARVKEFLTDQLLHCLYYTGQWAKMRVFLEQCKQQRSTDGGMQLFNMRTDTQLQLLEALTQDYECSASESLALGGAMLELSEWPRGLNGTRDPAETTFSYYNIIRHLEEACVAHILKDDGTQLVQDVQEAICLAVEESACRSSTLKRNVQLIELYILNHVSQKLTEYNGSRLHELGSMVADWSGAEDQSTLQMKILLWTLLFERRFHGAELGQGRGPGQPHAQYLDVTASARREGNANLCHIMLRRFFALKGFTEPLQKTAEQMQSGAYTVNIEDADLLRGFGELAKCQYANSAGQLDAINLGATYCAQIIQQVGAFPQLDYPHASADMLLTLAEWLSQRGAVNASASAMNSPQLQQLLEQLPEISLCTGECHEQSNALIPIAEKAVGRLINASVLQKNKSAEGWYAFGNWCYRWGKRIMETRNAENHAHKGTLPQRELNAIKEVLGGNVSDDLMNQLMNVFSSHQPSAGDADAEEDIEKSDVISAEVVENELRHIDGLADKPFEQITSIIQIWRQAHRSMYAYYEMATMAYFKYLAIESNQESTPKTSSAVGDCTSVTTTLRLLRLIVKHAAGLQDVFEEGLRTTPLRPWKVIIPQLFSRLSHHEPYVRKSVSDLLCRLARDRPHLIIFPAVVGAHQESACVSVPKCKSVDEHSSINKTGAEQKPAALSSCFGSLLHTLSKQAPETVLHVQLLVKELKRVTLLWEEYWVHSLSQLYSEYSSLFASLETEMKKCGESQLEKISAKYEILMKHITFDLQRIASVTEKEADTSYERNFQERYNAVISSTISELQQPFRLSKPLEGWVKIKQLYNLFQQRTVRGCASTLKIADLSPVLAGMRNTAISMPGVDTFEKHPVFIRSVDSTVHILPTKTKPKKLAFCGSDGRRYTYLFKGLEDLHLDERIMQFLSISNSMMARAGSGDTRCGTNGFKAHHYSVIPLGPQSGLISWVDGVTPLFAIYKKWQQRDAALKQQQKERQPANQGAQQQCSVPAATRPSELFYSKLTPLLAEHNMKVTDPRKQWPVPVLRRVLEELVKETPRDLLSRELWCCAVNAVDWRRSVCSYSISMAVMSVIGYVIGLGDRHLDNVLIKLGTGEIVHIDYNVCFEKGKTLRVPEKVPFRMTPNLEEALGITGVEGTFRLGCEHVLKILRKERETLLTLLEAFVYDPLVDWTVSDDGTANVARSTSAYAAALSIATLHEFAGGSSLGRESGLAKLSGQDELVQRKQEWECSRHSIEMKFNEFKPDWIKHNDEVHHKLLHIYKTVEQLMCVQQEIRREEQGRDNLTKQLAMIRELEALGSARGSHALNTISDRYKAYKRDVEAFNVIKKGVQKYQIEICGLLDTYFERLIAASPHSELKNLQLQLSEQQQQQTVSANELEAVQGLLEEGGQADLYAKCDFVRKEMVNTLYQVSWCAMDCLERLQQYASVMQFYPRSRLQQNRLVKYEQWCRQLLSEERTIAALKRDLEQCFERDMQTDKLDGACVSQYSAALEKIWIELNFELRTAVNELNEHTQLMVNPVEAAEDVMQSFIALDPERHSVALQSCVLDALHKTIESFLLYEEAVQNSNEELLNQQLNFVEMCMHMCQAVLPDVDQQVYAAMQVLEDTLQSLLALKSAFELSLAANIVRLFMRDDVVELQEALARVCSSTASNCLECLEFAREDSETDELCSLFSEIDGLFGNFESHLQQLEEVASKLMDSSMDSKFKQLVRSRFAERGLHLSLHELKCQTIAEVFCAARDSVNSLKTNAVQRVYDIRAILVAGRSYVSQLEMSTLGGLASFFAHVLHCNVMVLAAAQQPTCCIDDEGVLLSADGLCQNFLLALQQNATIKGCQLQVLQYSKWVEHSTLVGTAHFWANERYLSDTPLMYGFPKDKLLKSVQSCNQSLSALKHTMVKIIEDMQQHAAAAIQQLNWAVEGNGSSLHLQEKFFECINTQTGRYNFWLQLTTQLLEYTQALLRFEMHCDSIAETDNAFGVILQQWQDASESCQLSGSLITPVEQAIVQLLDPEGKVDQCWIENIAGLLDEMTFGVQRKLANLEQDEQSIIKGLYEDGQQLQVLIESPVRIDLRHLLKQISKVDRIIRGGMVGYKSLLVCVRELQHMLKCFYSKLGELQILLVARSFSAAPLHLRDRLSSLMAAAEKIHNELLGLMYRFTKDAVIVFNNQSAPSTDALQSMDALKDNSSVRVVNEGVAASSAADKKGIVAVNHVEQKRNAYAVSVWKRIRMKLEGRDPDPNRRSSVLEQVDFIVREAMNPDNLAVLYEGWTPWV